MGYVRYLAQHRDKMHPRLLAVFDMLDSGTLPGLDWEKVKSNFLSADGSIWSIEAGFRSWEDQDEIFQNHPELTGVPGGKSYHQWGLAVDMIFTRARWNMFTYENRPENFSLPDVYEKIGIVKAMKDAGIDWLGKSDLVDVGHWELRINHPSAKEKSGLPWWNDSTGDAEGLKKMTFKLMLIIGILLIVKGFFNKGPSGWWPHNQQIRQG